MAPARARFVVILLLALGIYAAGTHPRVFAAGNDLSRWAHVEALVDYGTPAIDRSRFAATVDRVEIDGRSYSNKPPLLALLAAVLYAPLAAATGWRLGDAASAGAVIWTLTVLLVALPAAATVAVFDRALGRRAALAPAMRNVLALALGAGTLLFCFAVTFQAHVAAALLLLGAFLAAIDGRGLRAGLLAGAAGAFDLLPGFGLAPFLGAVALGAGTERRPTALRFCAGLGAGALLLAGTNLATTGSPLPAKMVPGAVDAAARAGPSVAGVVLPQGGTYWLEVLFGAHGLFLVSPVLLLGAAGLLVATRRAPFARAPAWRWLLAGIAVQIAGHALLAGSYGGWSYGYRYLLPIQPLLLLAAAAVTSGRWWRAGWALLLPPSVLFAALGAFHPWPPAYEQASSVDPVAALVRDPIGGNAAALAERWFPGGALAEALGRRFVAADPEQRRRYYWLFFASKGDLETMRRYQPPQSRAPGKPAASRPPWRVQSCKILSGSSGRAFPWWRWPRG